MVLFFDDPRALYCPPEDDVELHEVYNVSALLGNHGRGPALDEQHCLSEGAPPLTAWRPLSDATVSLTVDRARQQSCEQAQREIDFIKQKAMTHAPWWMLVYSFCLWLLVFGWSRLSRQSPQLSMTMGALFGDTGMRRIIVALSSQA